MGKCSLFQKPARYKDKACDYAKDKLPHKFGYQRRTHPECCGACPGFQQEEVQKKVKRHGFFNNFLPIVDSLPA